MFSGFRKLGCSPFRYFGNRSETLTELIHDPFSPSLPNNGEGVRVPMCPAKVDGLFELSELTRYEGFNRPETLRLVRPRRDDGPKLPHNPGNFRQCPIVWFKVLLFPSQQKSPLARFCVRKRGQQVRTQDANSLRSPELLSSLIDFLSISIRTGPQS